MVTHATYRLWPRVECAGSPRSNSRRPVRTHKIVPIRTRRGVFEDDCPTGRILRSTTDPVRAASAGVEPAAVPLTAGCSTVELRGNAVPAVGIEPTPPRLQRGAPPRELRRNEQTPAGVEPASNRVAADCLAVQPRRRIWMAGFEPASSGFRRRWIGRSLTSSRRIRDARRGPRVRENPMNGRCRSALAPRVAVLPVTNKCCFLGTRARHSLIG